MLPFTFFLLLVGAALIGPELSGVSDEDEGPDNETPEEEGPGGEGPDDGDPDDENPDDGDPDDADPDDGDPDEEEPGEEAPARPIVVPAGEGAVLQGTAGGDAFALAGDVSPDTPAVGLSLDAGDGDDDINLLEGGVRPDPAEFEELGGFVPPVLSNGTVEGGAGDDTILTVAENTTLSGGAGNDVIENYSAVSGAIFGGDGDDSLYAALFATDGILVDGGAGNDLIDVSDATSVRALGGDGDDTILVGGYDEPGAGYVISAEGGAGDDRIVLEDGEGIWEGGSIFAPMALSGGTGADVFEIEVTSAFSDDFDVFFADTGAPDAETVVGNVVTIGDFEPGVDQLVIVPQAEGDYVLGETRIEEDLDETGGDAGITRVIVTFVSPTGPEHEMVVTVDATGLTLDDVVFVT